IDADSSRREQLVQESLGSTGKSGRNTRKRRRRRKSASAENGAPAEGHGGAGEPSAAS
ncbi:MAG: polynucleotide adenylyltransferase PcnB, partial [Lautropia mirabilis]|nr:polynucleotide adenylyltransferase PcnB [Lautropia mirabilis]